MGTIVDFELLYLDAQKRIRELEAELAALCKQHVFAWNALDSAMSKDHDRKGSLAEAVFNLVVERDTLRKQQGEPVAWLYESKNLYWVSSIRDKDKSEGVTETPLYREAAGGASDVERVVRRCRWDYDEDMDAHETECGHAFTLIEGTPAENDMRFCPYCGGELWES